MAGASTGLKHKAERAAFGLIIDHFLKNLHKTDDRVSVYRKLLDKAETFWGNKNPAAINKLRKELLNPESKWFRLVDRLLVETHPNVAKTFLLNLGYEAFFRGTKQIRENREKYGCNIPWLILFDPTNACNLRCVGCWSGTYGDKCSLSYEDMDRIVTQGKELGSRLYMLTGGEPLVRKKDILKLAEQHYDCEFALYTNSTLIDEALCKEVQRLGNITFQLSIEGTPETNDGRRGDGHYDAVMKAMDLLKSHGIIFGTSICYTRDNIEAVTDLDFIRMLADKGAVYGFYFHYMPIGNNAVVDLMPTMAQRKAIIDRIRYVRTEDCDIEFFPMDFQNDGEFVGGCIAGGRNYFHINASGDAEPCVFIHFSDANIHTHSILEILQSPLFMEYHKGQPFNHNHLRPCPMLENPDALRGMVHRTGAKSTNEESEESVEQLCAKCDCYANEWKPEAEKIWGEEDHVVPVYVNYSPDRIKELENQGVDVVKKDDVPKEGIA